MGKIHGRKYLHEVRKKLRRDITIHESKLWVVLKDNGLGYKFRRQHSVGNFIADFYCPAKSLVIELDGSQHSDNKEYDKERTEYFNNLGIKVIRFWNSEIDNHFEAVILNIIDTLNS